MKRLWTAAALLIALLGFTLFHSFYLSRFSNELTTILHEAEAKAESGHWENAQDLTNTHGTNGIPMTHTFMSFSATAKLTRFISVFGKWPSLFNVRRLENILPPTPALSPNWSFCRRRNS